MAERIIYRKIYKGPAHDIRFRSIVDPSGQPSRYTFEYNRSLSLIYTPYSSRHAIAVDRKFSI